MLDVARWGGGQPDSPSPSSDPPPDPAASSSNPMRARPDPACQAASYGILIFLSLLCGDTCHESERRREGDTCATEGSYHESERRWEGDARAAEGRRRGEELPGRAPHGRAWRSRHIFLGGTIVWGTQGRGRESGGTIYLAVWVNPSFVSFY